MWYEPSFQWLSRVILGIGAIFILIQPLWGIYLTVLLSPLQTFALTSGPLSLTRLAGAWTAVAALAAVITRRRTLRFTGVEGPIIMIGLTMSISFLRTPNTMVVAYEILQFGSLFMWAFLIPNLVESNEQLKKLALVFLASGIIPIASGLLEWLQKPKEEVGFALRVKGTFLLPTGLASFLVFFLIFALALLFYPGLSRLWRFVVGGAFGAGVVALLVTMSRGPIAGVILGFGLVLYLLRSRIQSMHRSLRALIVVSLIFGVFYVLWPLIGWRLWNPLVEQLTTGATTDQSVIMRLREISLIRQFLADYGVLGTGIGNYTRAIYKYQVLLNDPGIPTVPHNIILYFVGEVGVLGLLGFLWLVAWLIHRARASYPQLKLTGQSLVYYTYIGSLATLLGYIPLMLTHEGLLTNEIWLGLAFFLTSARMGVEMVEAERRLTDPLVIQAERQARVGHAYRQV